MAQEPEKKVEKKEEKKEIQNDISNSIGKRIQVEKFKGTIRYIGPVATSKKSSTIWLGIEWDDENRGKHDGSVIDNDGKVNYKK